MDARNDVPFVNDGLVNICRNGYNARVVNKQQTCKLMNENVRMKGFARKKHSKNDSFDKSCISDRAYRQAGKLNNQIFINLRVRTYNFNTKVEKEF